MARLEFSDVEIHVEQKAPEWPEEQFTADMSLITRVREGKTSMAPR
jgi:N-dimethylarginine dimethylaminohydrolase